MSVEALLGNMSVSILTLSLFLAFVFVLGRWALAQIAKVFELSEMGVTKARQVFDVALGFVFLVGFWVSFSNTGPRITVLQPHYQEPVYEGAVQDLAPPPTTDAEREAQNAELYSSTGRK